MSLEKGLKESDLVLDAQRQSLIDAAPRSLAVSVAAAVLCFCLLRTEVDMNLPAIWIMVNLTITIIRAAVLWHISNAKDSVPNRLEKQVNLLTTTIGIAGISWGSLVFLWTPILPVVTQLQILLFPVTLTAGAVSGYGMWLKAYTIFMLGCILPMTVGFLLIENGTYTGTAAPAVLYMVALFVLCKSYEKSVIESIKLRFETIL